MTEPQLVDAFFQANLMDGWGYLDVRGALVRQFRSDFDRAVELQEAGLTSLVFSNPTSPTQPITELKINLQMIWMRFRSGTSRAALRQEVSRVADSACRLMQAT
jgi:hypothetical protein